MGTSGTSLSMLISKANFERRCGDLMRVNFWQLSKKPPITDRPSDYLLLAMVSDYENRSISESEDTQLEGN
jgi:hypothetical protein